MARLRKCECTQRVIVATGRCEIWYANCSRLLTHKVLQIWTAVIATLRDETYELFKLAGYRRDIHEKDFYHIHSSVRGRAHPSRGPGPA
jgi:hypothetical protein